MYSNKVEKVDKLLDQEGRGKLLRKDTFDQSAYSEKDREIMKEKALLCTKNTFGKSKGVVFTQKMQQIAEEESYGSDYSFKFSDDSDLTANQPSQRSIVSDVTRNVIPPPKDPALPSIIYTNKGSPAALSAESGKSKFS